MKRFIVLICLLCMASFAHATDYYVRTDGSDLTHCNGKTDAPRFAPSLVAGKPGKDNTPACAWDSPMIAFPPPAYGQQPHPRVANGDTVHVGLGKFPVGWIHAKPIHGSENCNDGLARDCGLGLKGLQHVTVVGKGKPSTEIYGTNGVFNIFGIANTNGVTFQHMTATDHAACDMHGGATDCVVKHAVDWAQNGFGGFPIANVTFDDVDCLGFANECMHIGQVDGFNFINGSRADFNSEAGIDFDGCGGSGNPCSNPGTHNFKDGEINDNGCTHDYPSQAVRIQCYSQNQGGYGDGLGTGHTGGIWNFINFSCSENSSDGCDILYGDDTAEITFDHVTAVDNAGNQLKARGKKITIKYSVINGNCSAPWVVSPGNNATAYPVPPLVMKYKFGGDGACRANGDAASVAWVKNGHLEFTNNTIAGGGGGMVVTTNEAPGDSDGATALYANNIFDGNNNVQWPTYNSCRTCGFADVETVYGIFDYNAAPVNTFSHNIFFGLKNNYCPAGSICSDPKLVGNLTTKFNPALQTGSPAIGSGDKSHCAVSAVVKCNIGAK